MYIFKKNVCIIHIEILLIVFTRNPQQEGLVNVKW